MNKIYGLSTARRESKSPPGKNLMLIHGKPLYLHNLLESMATPEIKDTYITTDIPEAIEASENVGFKVITLEDEMYGDNVSHTDVIYRGMLEIEKDINDQIDILVVMLGNTVNMDRYVVKNALDILNKEPETDSVVTVIRQNHFNPLRVYVDNGKGYLTTYLDQAFIKEKTSKLHLSDKNAQGDILFQNGLWILRRHAVVNAKEKQEGLLPFAWFGHKVRYLEQDPGLQEVDDLYQLKLLQ